jgi:N-acetylhexosamine 1-kinase
MTDQPHDPAGSAAQLERALHIASFFNLAPPLEVRDFPEKGNINQHTYLVVAESSSSRTQYLLQLLNPGVFIQPHAAMRAMIACIQAQRRALSKGVLGDEEWETIQLVPTRDGKDYLEMSGECWRMMLKIPQAHAYRNLQQVPDPHTRLRVAEEAGRGLALFGNLTAGMDVSRIGVPLPGYRDTALYYSQFLSVLAGCRSASEAEPYLPADPVLRSSTAHHFLIHIDPLEYRRRLDDPQLRELIKLALGQQPFGLTLAGKLESGELKRAVIHGDTKLDNFLFSTRTGRVKALVDLDTIMSHTWLSDWGDMVRSLVNIAGERESDLGRIAVDLEVLGALTRGFLGSTHTADSGEIALMVEAPQIMALELGVRFLADYLRGDSYFKLMPGEPLDLNKTRAMVQFRLFERLRGQADATRQIIDSLHR